MSLVQLTKNPSRRDLNIFCVLLVVFFTLVGGFVFYKTGSIFIPRILWFVALALGVLFTVLPKVRKPIYLGWIYLVFPIGWSISHLILVIIYYLVLTPTGIIMRMLGRDPMQRRFDSNAKSYWIPSQQTKDVSRYFRQM